MHFFIVYNYSRRLTNCHGHNCRQALITRYLGYVQRIHEGVHAIHDMKEMKKSNLKID